VSTSLNITHTTVLASNSGYELNSLSFGGRLEAHADRLLFGRDELTNDLYLTGKSYIDLQSTKPLTFRANFESITNPDSTWGFDYHKHSIAQKSYKGCVLSLNVDGKIWLTDQQRNNYSPIYDFSRNESSFYGGTITTQGTYVALAPQQCYITNYQSDKLFSTLYPYDALAGLEINNGPLTGHQGRYTGITTSPSGFILDAESGEDIATESGDSFFDDTINLYNALSDDLRDSFLSVPVHAPAPPYPYVFGGSARNFFYLPAGIQLKYWFALSGCTDKTKNIRNPASAFFFEHNNALHMVVATGTKLSSQNRPPMLIARLNFTTNNGFPEITSHTSWPITVLGNVPNVNGFVPVYDDKSGLLHIMYEDAEDAWVKHLIVDLSNYSTSFVGPVGQFVLTQGCITDYDANDPSIVFNDSSSNKDGVVTLNGTAYGPDNGTLTVQINKAETTVYRPDDPFLPVTEITVPCSSVGTSFTITDAIDTSQPKSTQYEASIVCTESAQSCINPDVDVYVQGIVHGPEYTDSAIIGNGIPVATASMSTSFPCHRRYHDANYSLVAALGIFTHTGSYMVPLETDNICAYHSIYVDVYQSQPNLLTFANGQFTAHGSGVVQFVVNYATNIPGEQYLNGLVNLSTVIDQGVITGYIRILNGQTLIKKQIIENDVTEALTVTVTNGEVLNVSIDNHNTSTTVNLTDTIICNNISRPVYDVEYSLPDSLAKYTPGPMYIGSGKLLNMLSTQVQMVNSNGGSTGICSWGTSNDKTVMWMVPAGLPPTAPPIKHALCLPGQTVDFNGLVSSISNNLYPVAPDYTNLLGYWPLNYDTNNYGSMGSYWNLAAQDIHQLVWGDRCASLSGQGLSALKSINKLQFNSQIFTLTMWVNLPAYDMGGNSTGPTKVLIYDAGFNLVLGAVQTPYGYGLELSYANSGEDGYNHYYGGILDQFSTLLPYSLPDTIYAIPMYGKPYLNPGFMIDFVTFQPETWTFLSIVVNGSSVTLNINLSSAGATNLPPTSNNFSYTAFGGTGIVNTSQKGSYRNIRLYDKALNGAELQNVYTAENY
jgi:hypothetical protein